MSRGSRFVRIAFWGYVMPFNMMPLDRLDGDSLHDWLKVIATGAIALPVSLLLGTVMLLPASAIALWIIATQPEGYERY